MRGMTAITSLLDDMASFTKGGPDFLRDGKIFSLDSHPFKRNGMTAHSKLGHLLFVTLRAFFRDDHGLLLRGKLVVNVTGHAMNTIFGMLRFDPRLKQSRGHLLMAVHTEPWVHIRYINLRAEKGACNER
jgi:hypothetical protein